MFKLRTSTTSTWKPSSTTEQRLARDDSDDVADEEDAEADQQHDRGGAQPRAQQHLRLLREVRPAARDLPLGTADLRPLAGAAAGCRIVSSSDIRRGACGSWSCIGPSLFRTIDAESQGCFGNETITRIDCADCVRSSTQSIVEPSP